MTDEKTANLILEQLKRVRSDVAEFRSDFNDRLLTVDRRLHAIEHRESAATIDTVRVTEQIEKLQIQVNRLTERLDRQELIR